MCLMADFSLQGSQRCFLTNVEPIFVGFFWAAVALESSPDAVNSGVFVTSWMFLAVLLGNSLSTAALWLIERRVE